MKTLRVPNYTKITLNRTQWNYTWDSLDFRNVFLLKILTETDIVIHQEENCKRLDIILNREFSRIYG